MSETIQTKRCSKCKDFKPLSEFHKDKSRQDELADECKICCSKYQKEYRKTDKSKLAKKRYNQSKKGKVAKRIRNKRFTAQHPERHKAKAAVNYAIKASRLPRPDTRLCHYCPKPAQEYHHWHGYEPKYWLDVVPVCIPCHRKCPSI